MRLTDQNRHLLTYLAVVIRRRWIVYASIAVAFVIALVGSFLAEPRYRATATLQIERQSPDILTFRDLAKLDQSWTAYADFYQTQYKILGSQPVSRLAADRLGLANRGGDRNLHPSRSWWSRLSALLPTRTPVATLPPEDVAAAHVLAALEVTPVRSSQLVKVSWSGPDPQLAADVTNAVAESYIQLVIQSKYQATDHAREFLVKQIGTLKREIAEFDERLQSYGESKRIVSIDESNNITLKALQNIAERRTEAQTALARAEAAYRVARESPRESLPEVVASDLITRLRQEYAGYEIEYSEQRQRFREDWPGLIALRSRLEQAGERLDVETERIAQQVRSAAEADYAKAAREVSNLASLLVDHEQDAQELKRNAVEFGNLHTDMTKKRETLDVLMTRQNEMALSTHLKDLDSSSTNIRIMERARPPVAPFRPTTRLNLIMGLLIGLGLGLALVFALEYLDDSVNSVDELKAILSAPVLAVIPKHGVVPAQRLGSRPLSSVGAEQSVDLVALRDPQAPASEAYRELRTSILLSNPGHPPQRVMVTSPLPEEGKSVSAVNLAVALAQLGRRVVLVDTDLRKPRLHRVFEASNSRGVSTFLSGLEADPIGLVVPTALECLDLLPSGPIPPNPSELLNSPVFGDLSRLLIAGGYDHVLFDSPPVLSVSDPMIIASMVDVKILVVRAARSSKHAVRLAAEKLQQLGNGPLGVVFNCVEFDSQFGSRYQYGSYYGGHDRLDERQPAARRASGSSA